MRKRESDISLLMKMQPLKDFYHEPEHKYTQKEGWFGVECEIVIEEKTTTKSLRKRKSKKETKS